MCMIWRDYRVQVFVASLRGGRWRATPLIALAANLAGALTCSAASCGGTEAIRLMSGAAEAAPAPGPGPDHAMPDAQEQRTIDRAIGLVGRVAVLLPAA